MKPLTKSNLDDLFVSGCENCGKHDHTLILSARCHINAPVKVSYTFGNDFLHIVCSICGKLVADVAIKEFAHA